MLPQPFVSTSHLSLLATIDAFIASYFKLCRCPWCKGPLANAPYARNPRGCHEFRCQKDFPRRLSLCCTKEGCRKRLTPPSVIFWGRLVYAGSAVVAMLCQPWKSISGEALRKIIGCSRATWRRWLDMGQRFWGTAVGRVIRGYVPLPKDGPPTIPEAISHWSGSEAYRAGRWLLLIHPLTGGKHWQERGIPFGPLDAQKMGFGMALAALQDVPDSR